MTRLVSVVGAAALLLLSPTRSVAQEASAPPAHISLVDGAAVLERDGQADTAPTSMPLLAGDRLRTQNGRVEVLFADASTLHLDTDTTVDLESDEVIRLTAGRIRLNIPGPSRAISYRVDAPGGWVQISEPGEYRIDIRGDERSGDVELAVLRGAAVLMNEDGQTSLRAGERAFARAGVAPSYPYVYNSAAWDAFDRWSEARRDERRGVSAQYLPDTVRPYASTFDQYGSWRYEPTYGYVWYPTVSVGWRPYYYGRWASLPTFGWTWIGLDAWSWPTHHYGRWGFSAGAWFWIPGRHWGPAWVSWAYAPGYVSWCPLGWNNRPVVQFVNVNIYRSGFDPWRAWTVVPRQRFGYGFVNRNVVLGSRIDVRTRDTFVVRDAAPNFGGRAVPRGTAPIYVAGGRRPVGSAPERASGDPSSRSITLPGRAAAPSRSAAEDAAAVFRSRRPQSEPVGPGLPAPARAPRNSAVLSDRAAGAPAASRSVGAPARADETGVPVHRGAVPRERMDPGADRAPDAAPRRLEVPGYRRSPAAAQPSTVTPPPGPGAGWSVPGARAPRGEERQIPAAPASPDRGYRRAPEASPGPPPGWRAVPRSAPDAAPMPDRRSGVIERRGPAPAPPPSAGPPPFSAPPREAAPPRQAAPPREAAPPSSGRPAGAPAQGRPSGGAPSRGTATARPRGGN